MTKLSAIPDHQLSITSGLCKHDSMLEVANSYLSVGAMLQRMRYARSSVVRSVRLKATTRIRSSTKITQMWRLMGLGLSLSFQTKCFAIFTTNKKYHSDRSTGRWIYTLAIWVFTNGSENTRIKGTRA